MYHKHGISLRGIVTFKYRRLLPRCENHHRCRNNDTLFEYVFTLGRFSLFPLFALITAVTEWTREQFASVDRTCYSPSSASFVAFLSN